MTIETIECEGIVTLKPNGWLDTASAQELGDAVETIENASAVIFDFDHVEYIASAGIRQVLACSRKAQENGWDFSVINVSNEVMNIFKLTCLDKKLNIVQK